MVLVKNKNIISYKSETSEVSNKYAGGIIKELDTANRRLQDYVSNIENPIEKVSKKYRGHPSID